MNPIATQQAALDNALITAEVPTIYMHQFRNTIKKIGKTYAYNFKLDKKKCRVNTEVLYDLLSFIKEIGYSGKCDMLSTIRTDQMHQPWRTFAVVINKCISGKTTRLDRLRESRAHILWAMYNQMNVDYVDLIWADFMYQANNREISSARKEHMPYPRFTKVTINHFISIDNTISMRNRINLHIVCDDTLLGSLKFVSKTEDYKKYGALIPDGMINQDIKDSKAYKTYLDYATGKVPPNKARKLEKPTSPKLKTVPASPKEPTQKDKRFKRPAKKSTTTPQQPVLSLELMKTLRKSKRGTHKLQAIGSSEEANFESEVFDEQSGKNKDTREETEENDDVNDEDDNDDDNKDDDGDNDDDSGNDDDGGREDQQNASHESGFMHEEEDAHVTLTTVHDKTEGSLQSSFVSSNFTSKLLKLDNIGPDINEIASLMNTLTISPPPLPFDQRVFALETKVTEFNQTSQFPKAVSSILSIVDNYLASKLKEEVNVAVRLQSNKLKEEAEAENQEFFNQVDSTMKAIIKEQVKAQVSKIMPHIEKYVTESLGAKVLVRSTNQP
nr:hypothetical protein [Tanacetum cinerariifolium]